MDEWERCTHCPIVPGPEGLGDGSMDVFLPVGGSLRGWIKWENFLCFGDDRVSLGWERRTAFGEKCLALLFRGLRLKYEVTAIAVVLQIPQRPLSLWRSLGSALQPGGPSRAVLLCFGNILGWWHKSGCHRLPCISHSCIKSRVHTAKQWWCLWMVALMNFLSSQIPSFGTS